MLKYETIFTNDDYLVINKPAGLLVHGAEHIKESTLSDQLIADYPQLIKIGDDPNRPGLMHRLDKLASGLMVIAKNQNSFDNLKNQFQKRLVEKYYLALVYGKISKDEAEISFPIARSAKGYKMAARPKTFRGEDTADGRLAITEFTVAQRFINYTLLKVKIKTGRTHQIRVHLAAYGHPLVGDDLYGTFKTKLKNRKINLGRIFLVANSLSFRNLNNEIVKYEIDLPEELQNFLNNIK
jgi:23S rRNA pseudouridine1911/1915/1917 synthase